jgi:hypothetical protein
MRFNDRSMALLGIPDLPVDAFKKEGGKIKLHGGGGPTTSYSQTSNIPEYAEPYVQRMMGATEKQIYKYGADGKVTGFQSYKPFEGETVAGFTPMQAQAMRGIQNYQLPGQTGVASQMTGMAGLGSIGAGEQYAAQATNPYATQAYMSPYIQNALAPQMEEARRQSNISGQQNAAQAVGAGAFGGSRFGLQEAERQRNLAKQQESIYGQGMQSAFQNAQQAQQFGAQLGLQGMGQGLQAAGQLGALGQQQYGQELGLMGQQMEVGAKQQAYEQARLNQIIQNYATEQQYPFIQLGTLSNMLRGLPMQASTTQMYQAQPSLLQQGIGMAGAYNQLSQAGAFKAEGGEIKEMASGGIASGVNPNKLPSMLEKLSDKQLSTKGQDKETDPATKEMVEAENARRAAMRGGMGIMQAANGGVVAFKDGGVDTVDNPFKDEETAPAPKPASKAAAPKAAAPKAAPVNTYDKILNPYLTRSPEDSPEIKRMRGVEAELGKEAALGIEGQISRREDMYKKYGIDPMAAFEKQRQEQEEQLKMTKEDARKAEHLRYAQMFAKFGSTPGPILKAALTAINDGIPDLLDDQAKTRAAQKEIKKVLFELDKSELLYKKGNVDEGDKAHQDAVKRLTDTTMAVQKAIFDEGKTQAQIAAELKSREITGKYGIEEARIRAAGSGGDGFKQTKEERLLEQAIDKAYKDETKTLQEKLSRWKSAPEEVQKKNAATISSIEESLRTKRAEIEARYKKQAATTTAPKGDQLSVGQVVDGYKFKGGDPKDKNNWAKE